MDMSFYTSVIKFMLSDPIVHFINLSKGSTQSPYSTMLKLLYHNNWMKGPLCSVETDILQCFDFTYNKLLGSNVDVDTNDAHRCLFISSII